jgi:nucleoside-diphosphate-sugar epimerase
MITAMAKSRDLVLPDKSIPSWLADLLGGISEMVWRGFSLKGEPPLTKHAAMVMSRECTLVGTKATAELGYKPVVTREQGLTDL